MAIRRERSGAFGKSGVLTQVGKDVTPLVVLS
jgi:hypothetical protein